MTLLCSVLLGVNAQDKAVAEDISVPDKADPNFHIYLCFGQSNMEGNARPEAKDYENVPERFKVMAAVDFRNPKREMGGTLPFRRSVAKAPVSPLPTISVAPCVRICPRTLR